jgi:hypothetical protein
MTTLEVELAIIHWYNKAEMKKTLAILGRLTKVVYVLFLLLGLLAGFIAWEASPPEYSYSNYLIHCSNGKSFILSRNPLIVILVIIPPILLMTLR